MKKYIKTILLYLGISLVISNYIYHAIVNDTYKTDIAMFILEHISMFVFSGSGIFVLIKIFLFKSHSEIISEFMFTFFKKRLENHEVFKLIESYNYNLDQMGYITNNESRLELLKDILKYEILYLSLFLSSSIQWIITSKSRNDIKEMSEFISSSFNEYTHEIVDIFKSEGIPQIIINIYLRHKKTFIEPVKRYILNCSNNKLPAFIVIFHIIDVISIGVNVFFGGFLIDIDNLNGDLKGVKYKNGEL
jgi:hypothetical protein